MAKKTDIRIFSGDKTKFVQGKSSLFQRTEGKRPDYYTFTKHLNSKNYFQNVFSADFGSQVIPTKLPGEPGQTYGQTSPPVPPVGGPYLLSQVGSILTSELGVGLIYEASYLVAENLNVLNTEGDDNIIYQ